MSFIYNPDKNSKVIIYGYSGDNTPSFGTVNSINPYIHMVTGWQASGQKTFNYAFEVYGDANFSNRLLVNNDEVITKNDIDFTGTYLNSSITMATANGWYDVLTGRLSPGLWNIDVNVTFFRPTTTLGTNTVKLWTIGFTGASTSVSFPSQANNFTSANISIIRNVINTENWILSTAGSITNNIVSSTGWHNVGNKATSIQAIKFR